MFIHTVEELVKEAGFEIEYMNFASLLVPIPKKAPLTHEEHTWYVTHDPEEETDDAGMKKLMDIEERLSNFDEASGMFKVYLKHDRERYLKYDQRRRDDILKRTENLASVEEQRLGIHIAAPLAKEPELQFGTMAAYCCVIRKQPDLPRLSEADTERLLANLNALQISQE